MTSPKHFRHVRGHTVGYHSPRSLSTHPARTLWPWLRPRSLTLESTGSAFLQEPLLIPPSPSVPFTLYRPGAPELDDALRFESACSRDLGYGTIGLEQLPQALQEAPAPDVNYQLHQQFSGDLSSPQPLGLTFGEATPEAGGVSRAAPTGLEPAHGAEAAARPKQTRPHGVQSAGEVMPRLGRTGSADRSELGHTPGAGGGGGDDGVSGADVPARRSRSYQPETQGEFARSVSEAEMALGSGTVVRAMKTELKRGGRKRIREGAGMPGPYAEGEADASVTFPALPPSPPDVSLFPPALVEGAEEEEEASYMGLQSETIQAEGQVTPREDVLGGLELAPPSASDVEVGLIMEQSKFGSPEAQAGAGFGAAGAAGAVGSKGPGAGGIAAAGPYAGAGVSGREWPAGDEAETVLPVPTQRGRKSRRGTVRMLWALASISIVLAAWVTSTSLPFFSEVSDMHEWCLMFVCMVLL